MKMYLFATLVALSLMAMVSADFDDDLSVAELKSMVDALEQRKQAMFEKASGLLTKVEGAERVFRDLLDYDLPLVNTFVDNMKDKTAFLSLQVAEIVHLTTHTRGDFNAAQTLKDNLDVRVSDLNTAIDNINSQNTAQQTSLNNIDSGITGSILPLVDQFSVTFNPLPLFQLGSALETTRDFQRDRQCLSGLVVKEIPSGPTPVGFQTSFDPAGLPKIIVTVVGFRAHLLQSHDYDSEGEYSAGSYTDLLGFNVTVVDNTRLDGFILSVTETQDSAVRPKDVYIHWLACNL